MPMQGNQIEMGLQWVVMVKHLCVHRPWVVMTGTTEIGHTIDTPLPQPVALPVRHPPTGLLEVGIIGEDQIDRAGEKAPAVDRQMA